MCEFSELERMELSTPVEYCTKEISLNIISWMFLSIGSIHIEIVLRYIFFYFSRFTCLSVNQPNSSTSSHLHTVTASPTHTTHNPPTLTLAHTDGSIVIHQLKDSGKTSTDDKLLAFENYLNRLF